MEEKSVGIGAAAKLTGLSAREIRYLEQVGVFAFPRKSGKHRYFTKGTIIKIIAWKNDPENKGVPTKQFLIMKEWDRELAAEKLEA